MPINITALPALPSLTDPANFNNAALTFFGALTTFRNELNAVTTADLLSAVPNGTAALPSIAALADTNTGLYFPAADTLGWVTGGAERMRIDASGDVCIGTTTPGVSSNNLQGIGLYGLGQINASIANFPILDINRKGSNGPIVELRFEGAGVGSIFVTNSATTYNTTSARHLKTNITPLDHDPGAKIDAALPRSFNWIATGERANGFIADEFADVFPASVTYDEDGLAVAIDAGTPEVMATVIAELQSLRARVAHLEAAH